MGLLDDKNRLILDADAAFADALSGVDNQLALNIIKIYAKFVQDKDLVIRAEDLAQLEVFIIEAIKGTSYSEAVNVFIPNFDALKELNAALHSKVNDIETATMIEENININNFINTVTSQLKAQRATILAYIAEDGLQKTISLTNNALEQLVNPIAEVIRQDIITGVTFESATEAMLLAIKDKKLGLEQWAGQIAKDSLSEADGVINQQIKDTYGLKFTRYTGSIKQTTRPFCYHMLTTRPDAVYSDDEIKKALAEFIPAGVPSTTATTITANGKQQRKGDGMKPGTDLQNFSIRRGGWNCRHYAVPAKNRRAIEKIDAESRGFDKEVL